MLLMEKGFLLSSTALVAAAGLQIVATLLQSKRIVPKQLQLTEEMGLLLLALSCYLMHGPYRQLYSALEKGEN
eukprot:SAG31_NODE_5457_length_2526_cov_1.346930_2_plen_73_part_00